MNAVLSGDPAKLQEFKKNNPNIDMQSISNRLKNSPMGTAAAGSVTFKTVKILKIFNCFLIKT